MTKRCYRCKQNKPCSEFHKNRSNKSGLAYWCKDCTKNYNRSMRRKATKKRYRQNEKGEIAQRRGDVKYRAKHPERIKARTAVTYAIKVGRLPRPDSFSCHYCPKPAKQWHHWRGYALVHRLDVVPACTECHRKAG